MSEKRVEVACLDCQFSRIVSVDDDQTPAEVVIEHKRETGRTVTLPLDE